MQVPCGLLFFKNNIDKVEQVQRRFTKRLLGLKKLLYDDRLTNLGIKRLEQRRLITDMTMCYKILHGHINVNTPDALERNFSITHGHNYKLTKKPTHSNSKSIFFDIGLLTAGMLYRKIPSTVELLINLSF